MSNYADDRIHLQDMLEALEGLQRCGRENRSSDIVKWAAERLFTILGEAVKRLSSELRAQYPDIPWKKIAGMRDMLVHEYDDIELPILWDTVDHEVPELKRQVKHILALLEERP